MNQQGTRMKIGIAGIGKMGNAIGSRLLGLGHSVSVWNRTPNKTTGLVNAGAHLAATPKLLAESVDVVLTLLTNEAALDEVYSGPHGLLSGAVSQKIFIDMSTVKPAKPKEMALRANTVGAVYLECPVGGSVGPAKEGKLLGFVGGDSADVEKIKPLLDQLCKRVEHVGPYGAGSTVKLAVNLPLMVYWQTLGESLSLVESLGIDPTRMIDILADSSGGPNMLKVRGAMIAQTLSQKKSDQVTVSVATMRKDMRAMIDQAQVNQRQLPLTSLALSQFNTAAETGLDDKDCTELPVWWLAKGSHQTR
jgi:3-hydroxyisobutyrate dehydrogenase